MKTTNTCIKENKSGVLVKGIEEIFATLRFFYNNCEEDKFITDLCNSLKETLAKNDYADKCFKNSGKGNFRNSWIEIRRIDEKEDLYLLKIHAFYTNPFVDKSIEAHLYDKKNLEYGVLSVDVNIEIAAEGEEFFIDCNQIVACI